MDIAQLGIKVDSAGVVKATGDLDKLTAAGGRADVAVVGVGKASVRAAGGMSAGAANARMMALQLSLVAQQSMAGGGFIRALANQLPDMAVGFGAAGIAASVVAGVALPLLASAFGGTSAKSEMAATAIEGLDVATRAYIAAAQAAAMPTDELAAKYGNLSVQAGAALAAVADQNLTNAIIKTNEAITSVIETLNTEGGRGGIANSLIVNFGLANSEAAKLNATINSLKSADGLQAQAIAAGEVQRQLVATFGSVAKMPPELQKVHSQMSTIILDASAINGQMQKTSGLVARATSAVSGLASAFADAASNAFNVAVGAAQAANALKVFNQNAAADAKVYSGRGGDPRTSNLKGGGFKYDGPAIDQFNNVIPQGGGGGGGGGGGATDDFAARLAALQTEHESETAQANKWYTDAQAVLADRRSIEVLGVQGHKDKLLEIEKIHQQQMAAIAANAHAARLNDTASLFGSLASIAEIGGKKSAKAAATLAAIQTTVAGYATAMSAAAVAPTLIGKIAAYAGWIGTSAKAVAAIRSAGGIGGGGGIGGAPAAQAIAPQAQESRLVVQGIKLTDILTGQMLMDILQKEFGARNVAFLR